MNADEGLRDRDESVPAESADADSEAPQDDAGEGDGRPEPSWWHRDHPTFTALTGFFTGLVVVILVPGAFAAILRTLFDHDTAEELFPLVLVTLAVPIVLIAVPRTRRFGRYMLLGMLATAAVVIGVAALVVWILIQTDS